VIDLSSRLGWGLIEPTQRHVIIVVRIADQLQGLIVDAVNDIVTINGEDLQPPPNMGDGSFGFLEGLVSVDDRMVMVLSLEALGLDQDVAALGEAA
jgi:purine-binding chemotaxis protein CheW